MSHYFGFGNIKLDNLNIPQGMNRTTGLDGSGKFGQKLHMKQKQIEVSESAQTDLYLDCNSLNDNIFYKRTGTNARKSPEEAS